MENEVKKVGKFKAGLFRLLLSGATQADVNKDGGVEFYVKVEIKTKKVETGIK